MQCNEFCEFYIRTVFLAADYLCTYSEQVVEPQGNNADESV